MWMALKHKIKHNLLTQIFWIQSRAKDFQNICITEDQFLKAFCYLVFSDAEYDCIIGVKKYWMIEKCYIFYKYFVFSLDGIIERYKKEEIVEGHTLGAPVTRVGSLKTHLEQIILDLQKKKVLYQRKKDPLQKKKFSEKYKEMRKNNESLKKC